MSLEVALDRNTAAIERLITLLETASYTAHNAHQVSELPADTTAPAEPTPPATVNVTLEQCQSAAARAVERLGNTVEAKTLVRNVIGKHGKLLKELDQLQRNAVFSDLENL